MLHIQSFLGTGSWIRPGHIEGEAEFAALLALRGEIRLAAIGARLSPCMALVLPIAQVLEVLHDEGQALMAWPLAGEPWSLLSERELVMDEISAAVLQETFFEQRCSKAHQEAALQLVGYRLLGEKVASVEAVESDVSAAPDLLDRALSYFALHLAEVLTMDRLLSDLQCSRSALLAVFKKAGRRSPMQELAELRVRRAQELLQRNEWTIAQIGAEIGYRDPASFTHFFKKRTGQSPRAYRDNALWLA